MAVINLTLWEEHMLGQGCWHWICSWLALHVSSAKNNDIFELVTYADSQLLQDHRLCWLELAYLFTCCLSTLRTLTEQTLYCYFLRFTLRLSCARACIQMSFHADSQENWHFLVSTGCNHLPYLACFSTWGKQRCLWRNDAEMPTPRYTQNFRGTLQQRLVGKQRSKVIRPNRSSCESASTIYLTSALHH